MFLLLLCLLSVDQGPHVKIPQAGMELQFPVGWRAKTEGVAPMAAVAEKMPRQGITFVMLDRNRPGVSRQSILDSYISHMKQTLKGGKVMSNTTLQIADHEVNRIEVQGKTDTGTLHHLSFLFSEMGWNVSVTFAGQSDHFEALRKDADAIMQTLKLTGRPGGQATDDLHMAIRKNTYTLDSLEKLVARGADLHTTNVQGHSSLMLAVMRGDIKLVKWVLDKGVKPDGAGSNPTLIRLSSTPAMRKLIWPDKPIVPENAGKLEVSWISPEAQLWAGIEAARMDYIKDALKKGASLEKPSQRYQLPALPMIDKIIAEFKTVGLASGSYEEVRNFLREQKENAVSTEGAVVTPGR